MTLGRLQRATPRQQNRTTLYGPHFAPTGRSVREVRARVRTGVLVRDQDVDGKAADAFSISAKARVHRRALGQATKAREGYYKARREARHPANAEETATGMCPGHPNIKHDSAKCPSTGSNPESYPGPPRARDLVS
eukprot:scaffold54578_cov36-Phaeocystis_antarctica.AAC.2